MNGAKREPASFRDPSGFVFWRDGEVFRQIEPPGLADAAAVLESGLWAELIEAELLLPADRLAASAGMTETAAAVLAPAKIPFVSYPYEWCFSQLKAAALLTLDIQRRCLQRGFALKDASAYNVQFVGTRPTFIDHLSIERRIGDAPWQAYRQFCRHFLAPLALMAFVDLRLGDLQRLWIDGVPLDLASRLLPRSTRWKPGLAMHLHMHARSEAKHHDGDPSRAQISQTAQLALTDSLIRTVEGLQPRRQGSTWGAYYAETNYSHDAMQAKRELISRFVQAAPGQRRLCWDLGANTGVFAQLAAHRYETCIAWDMDPNAVEEGFRAQSGAETRNVLPLILDLTNPSPAQGWAHRERHSWLERGPADLAMGLALVHHLAIGNNVPLPDVAELFATCGRAAIVEFVPKSDSQVVRMLRTRTEPFENYTEAQFEVAFRNRFRIIESAGIPGTERTLYLLERVDS